MTDRPSSWADDSPEIAEVRRLLADSRHTEPMPADVTARMEGVLAELSGAAAAAPLDPAGADEAEVTAMVAAHRRHRAAGLLVAAAAIVVGGFAVAQNLPSAGPGSRSATTAAEEHAEAGGDSSLDLGASQNDSPTPSSQDRLRIRVHHGRVVVRPRHFTDDALEGRRLLGLQPARAQNLVRPCTEPAGPARAVPAEYRNAPATLVFRRPQGDSQVVDLFVCGTSQAVRSTTLPAP